MAEARAEERNWVVRVCTDIRSVRSEMNVPAGARIPVHVTGVGEVTRQRVARHEDTLARLARLVSIELADGVPTGAVQIVVGEATLALPLAGVIDISAESGRLSREIARIEADIAKIDGKLANEKFLARAPEHVVDEQRERRADATAERDKLASALTRLQGVGESADT